MSACTFLAQFVQLSVSVSLFHLPRNFPSFLLSCLTFALTAGQHVFHVHSNCSLSSFLCQHGVAWTAGYNLSFTRTFYWVLCQVLCRGHR